MRLVNNYNMDKLNNDWYKTAPIIFMYEQDTPRSKYISTELRQFYFGNESIGPDTYDDLAHVRKNLTKYVIYKNIKY